eukprot:Selendium_serpulae@DN5795_c0_g1_i2.p1
MSTLFCYIFGIGWLLPLLHNIPLVSGQREDVTDNTNLKLALNSALMSAIYSGDVQFLMSEYGNHHRISTICNTQATYSAPRNDSLSPGDGLKAVLDSKTLNIKGMEANWGSDGDYTVTPPTGFWPEYLNLVVSELNRVYDTTITVNYTWEDVGSDVEGSIPLGVDTSDIYYLINALVRGTNDNITRATYYDIGCPAAVVDNQAITRQSDGILSFRDMLMNVWNLTVEEQKMGVLSEANRDVVKAAFPSTVTWHIYDGDEALAIAVSDATVYAGMTTGRLDDLLVTHNLTALPSGLLSYFGFLTRHKYGSSSAARSHRLFLPFAALICTFLFT